MACDMQAMSDKVMALVHAGIADYQLDDKIIDPIIDDLSACTHLYIFMCTR